MALDELRASCHAAHRRPIFGAKFLQSDMVFGIVNPFSWKVNAISSEMHDLIAMPFLLNLL